MVCPVYLESELAYMVILCRKSRRILKRYIVIGTMVSQMEKVFSLLVESGLIYCALWVSPEIPFKLASSLH